MLLKIRAKRNTCARSFALDWIGLVSVDTQMIDMCRMSTTYTDQHGAYLVTPDFPFSYAAGRHCSCTLRAAASATSTSAAAAAARDARQLALEFVHVRLGQHDDDSCHDWIDVQVTQ